MEEAHFTTAVQWDGQTNGKDQMTSTRCEELRQECLDQSIEARQQNNPAWVEAQMKRLHCLGNMKEKILTREAKEKESK